MKKNRKPKSELQKLVEGINSFYKLYKENEFWIDPLVKLIRNYNEQERLRKYNESLHQRYYVVNEYVWIYPLPLEAYQKNPQLYLYYPAQLMIQQTIYPVQYR